MIQDPPKVRPDIKNAVNKIIAERGREAAVQYLEDWKIGTTEQSLYLPKESAGKPATYGPLAAIANGAMLGGVPSLLAANRANQALGTDPRGMLDEPLAAQYASTPGQMPTPQTASAQYHAERAAVGQAQSQFRKDNPILNPILELGGAVASGKAVTSVAMGISNSLVRLTGLAPKWARRVAPLIAGTGAGTVSGGMNAPEGQTLEGMGEGAKMGFLFAAGTEVAAKVLPIIQKMTGTTTKAQRDAATNAFVLDKLARNNRDLQVAIDEADKILEVMGHHQTVLEAMGPEAGKAVLQGGVPILGAEMGAQAAQFGGALRQPIVPPPPTSMGLVSSVVQAPVAATRHAPKARFAMWAQKAAKLDLNKAKQIAVLDMGMSSEQAKVAVELAEVINHGRVQLAKVVEEAAKRGTASIEEVMTQVATAGLHPRSMMYVPAALARAAAPASSLQKSEELMRTLMSTDPKSFFDMLGQFKQTEPGRQMITRVLRGGMSGAVGGRMGGAGVEYQER